MNPYEELQYHPRYARGEYLDLEAAERRQRRVALFGLVLAIVCAAGLVLLAKG